MTFKQTWAEAVVLCNAGQAEPNSTSVSGLSRDLKVKTVSLRKWRKIVTGSMPCFKPIDNNVFPLN